MNRYIDAEKLKAELKKLSESDNPIEYSSMEKSAYNCALYDVEYLITSLQQEQPEVELEKAARNVCESWMGSTMDDFLRDMAELRKALNAKKEE